jgi:hypothetical protein
MAEGNTITFTHQEVAEALIKSKDIHEGFWSIYVEFGLGATNVASDPDGTGLLPAAVIPIVKLGIHKHDSPTPLTVDAEKVNPQ